MSIMDYNYFDNTKESRPQYFELHGIIKDLLKIKPMTIYQIRQLVPHKYVNNVTSQLQFLKSKGVVVPKLFGGIRYWGLTFEVRNTYKKFNI